MSLFPVRVKRDSVNGGTYDYRAKAAAMWREALENGTVASGSCGSRDKNDFYGHSSTSTEWVEAEFGTLTATMATVAKEHGVVRFSGSSATVGEGAQYLRAVPATGIMIQSDNVVCCEFSLELLSTAPTFFAGLFNATGTTDGVLTVTSGALTTTKARIGFYRLSASDVLGNLTFVTLSDNAGTSDSATVLTAAEVATLIGAGKANLGFRVNGRGSVEIFVNGEYYKTASESISAAALPLATLALTPAIGVVQYATATTPSTYALDMDWYETFVSP